MRVCLKHGIQIDKLTPQGVLILIVVAGVYDELGLNCTVTSGNDPGHMDSSKHYEGNALDFRTRDIQPVVASKIPGLCRIALGPDFDVVYENKDGVTHLHVEYDPKSAPLSA